MSKAKAFLEHGPARLFSKYKNCDYGTISAYCSGKTMEENQENSAKLKAILIGAEFSVTAVDGTFLEKCSSPDVREIKKHFFLVFDYKNKGSLKELLTKLGEIYDQDCISYRSAADGVYCLIGTAKREMAYPGYQNVMILDTPLFNGDGRFNAAIQGSPFVFDAVSEEYHDFDDTLLNYNTWHKQIVVRGYEKFCV